MSTEPLSGTATAESTIDRSPGTTTEFPLTRDLAAVVPEEENDYHPEIFEAPADEGQTRALSRVAWAATDRSSPCYSHLLVEGGDNLVVEKSFDIGKAELELLIAANRFRPQGKNDIIAFGLRGARLRDGEKVEQADRIPLEDARPDHRSFRCVVGYYFRSSGKLSAYTASTVPWHEYMSSGVKNNMLPTGCYVYKKGTHAPQDQSRWVTPALRMSDANGAHSGPATVLRTRQDLVFDLADVWDQCSPSDNIHCAYSNSKFSSLGCQTVKGGMHDGLWAAFQATLKSLPDNARIDYVLVTGAECSIAAALVKAGLQPGDPEVLKRLGRLRAGSESEEVKSLQTRLGLTPTGYFGAATKKKLTDYQAANGLPADGIFSPAMDAGCGWGVLSPNATAERSVPAEPEQVPSPPVPSAAMPEPAPQPAPAPEPAPQPAPASAPTAQPAPAPVPRPAVVLTAATLETFAPNAKAEYLAILGDSGDDVLTRFGINQNAKRFCHFMAQVGHECGGFTITHENLNYSAARMVQIFGPGKHSARITASEAQRLVGNKEAFAERVYGLGNPTKARDLGNTQPGDGYRYRGRGFLQITGRAAYREMGRKIDVDLEGNPDLAAEPLYALMTAAAFWDTRKLNDYADQNNIELITKRINGGHNGLDDRKNRYGAALRIWGGGGAGVGRSLDLQAVHGRQTLEYGDLRPDVLELKKLLVQAGYGGFEMDQDFSRATHMAVVQFKMARGLPGDGVVDAATWDALEQEVKAVGDRAATPASDGRAPAADGGRSRKRGWAVLRWGVLLFLATAAVVAMRYMQDAGFVAPRSPWEWIVLGFVGLVAIGSIALMVLGGGIIRANNKAPAAPATLQFDELGIRPEVNLGGAS